MTTEETLNRWKKVCTTNKLQPICIITMTEDGFPYVISMHDIKLLQEIYRHLADDKNPTETKVPIINEN